MKMMKRSIAAAALLTSVLGAPAYAATFSNTWSFTDQVTGQTVAGTLDGLQNGTSISASGLTATVTKSPFADLLGTYSLASGFAGTDNSYSASNGVVTFASFLLRNSASTSLYFGTQPFTAGGSTFYPQLVNSVYTENAYNQTVGTSFAAAAGAVPEPATWAMMLVGVGMMGFAMRRRNKNVSTTVRFA